MTDTEYKTLSCKEFDALAANSTTMTPSEMCRKDYQAVLAEVEIVAVERRKM